MDHALDGVLAKLKRANDHARDIDIAIEEFAKSDFYEIATERDYKGRLIGRTVNVKVPDPALGVLIGDCIHCLRSALDHLAFQLALGSTGRLPEGIARDSAFPIFRTHALFRGEGNGRGAAYKMAGMSRHGRASIQRVQPYHRRKHPLLFALWQLEELSKIDKHRLLPTVGVVPRSGSFGIEGAQPGVEINGLRQFPGPIKEGRRVVMFLGGPFPSPADIQVHADFTADIAFEETCEASSVRGFPVQAVLGGVFAALGIHVFPELNPELHRRLGVVLHVALGD